ncbi:SRPBCC domain-containing protein [Nitratireductor rhodophyticola]|uniref:SRPBCC domain-containing protein n=1 Tax=Nitratireductor rhodophyticola TaxID=2854036 RepID=UPI0008141B20
MSHSRTITVTARGDRELVITRRFNAPRQMVFDAHTRPELIKRWMTGPENWTLPVCEIDLRAGGKGRYVWHNTENGADMGMTATYREIDAPHRIVHEEMFDEDWTGGGTEIITTFEDDGETTRMEMVIRCTSKEARDNILKSPMSDGMEQGYARLDRQLAERMAA